MIFNLIHIFEIESGVLKVAESQFEFCYTYLQKSNFVVHFYEKKSFEI